MKITTTNRDIWLPREHRVKHQQLEIVLGGLLQTVYDHHELSIVKTLTTRNSFENKCQWVIIIEQIKHLGISKKYSKDLLK